MKVKISNGRITAEAESAEDMRALLAYASTTRSPKASGLHRKACPTCGKKVKLLAAHVAYNHAPVV